VGENIMMKYVIILLIASLALNGLLVKCVHDINEDIITIVETDKMRMAETLANHQSTIILSKRLDNHEDLLRWLLEDRSKESE
jgi:hypothetical protein